MEEKQRYICPKCSAGGAGAKYKKYKCYVCNSPIMLPAMNDKIIYTEVEYNEVLNDLSLQEEI